MLAKWRNLYLLSPYWEGCLLFLSAIQERYRTRCEGKQPTFQVLLATKEMTAKTVAGGGTWTAGPSAGVQSNHGMSIFHGICSQVGRATGSLCWRRGFKLLWQRIEEKIIDYIHWQSCNDHVFADLSFLIFGKFRK